MTEKNYNAEQMNAKSLNKQSKAKKVETPVKKEEKVEDKVKNEEKKIKTIKVKKIKKDVAVVNGTSLPISTIFSVEICRYIKGKKIDKAIGDLELAINKKKAIPMRGEYAHKKGSIAGGKYPKKSSENFIRLLKSLKANAVYNEIEDPYISEAYANKAQRPFGRFGRTQKKRTHVVLKAMEKKK